MASRVCHPQEGDHTGHRCEWSSLHSRWGYHLLLQGYVDVYMCGASLISTGVVLTSGHCVNHTDSLQGKLMVRCGEWDTHGEVEELKHQQIDVKTILVSCLLQQRE